MIIKGDEVVLIGFLSFLLTILFHLLKWRCYLSERKYIHLGGWWIGLSRVKIFFWLYGKVSPLSLDKMWQQNVRVRAWRGVQDERGSSKGESLCPWLHAQNQHATTPWRTEQRMVWHEMGMHDTSWHDIARAFGPTFHGVAKLIWELWLAPSHFTFLFSDVKHRKCIACPQCRQIL